MNVELSEDERQTLILAIAKLSLSRPGWHPGCLSPLAEKLGGLAMYAEFRTHGPDAALPGTSPAERTIADSHADYQATPQAAKSLISRLGAKLMDLRCPECGAQIPIEIQT